MREIKFRIWDNEKMHYPEFFEFGFSHAAQKQAISIPQQGGFLTSAYIMQWTGLKDKNGVEIYESDRLSFDDRDDWIVRFSDSAFWVYCQTKEIALFEVSMFDCEVIGNTYEDKITQS